MNNIYEDFILHLKEKENSLTGYVEKHRIVPGHSGGKYEDGNIVLVSFPDHCLAHFYRYLAYGNSVDLYAYHKMVGDTEEARISRSRSGGESARRAKTQAPSMKALRSPTSRRRPSRIAEPSRRLPADPPATRSGERFEVYLQDPESDLPARPRIDRPAGRRSPR